MSKEIKYPNKRCNHNRLEKWDMTNTPSGDEAYSGYQCVECGTIWQFDFGMDLNLKDTGKSKNCLSVEGMNCNSMNPCWKRHSKQNG